MEFLLGGVASAAATFKTNPLEVVKVRMQLQGELKKKGKFVVHYKNIFHAFYQILTKEGPLALHKGMAPAVSYGFTMNAVRLGLFDIAEKKGLTKTPEGKVDVVKSALLGCFVGATASALASPFSLLKARFQSKANPVIAVGHQHEYEGMANAIRAIIKQHGILGLWRGVTTTVTRVMVSSSVNLTVFSKAREFVTEKQYFPEKSLWNSFCASLLSGLAVSVAMAPFDLVSVRYCNQHVEANGKGQLYSSVSNCALKIFKTEGILGFYKGWTATYFRFGPYMLLTMMFWDQLRRMYKTNI